LALAERKKNARKTACDLEVQIWITDVGEKLFADVWDQGHHAGSLDGEA
jgi:hypothetical protein